MTEKKPEEKQKRGNVPRRVHAPVRVPVVRLLEERVRADLVCGLEPLHVRDRQGRDLHVDATDVSAGLSVHTRHGVDGVEERVECVLGGLARQQEKPSVWRVWM